MEVNFARAKKAVRRGARSGYDAIDVAHDISKRKLSQASDVAEDALDAGDRATRSTISAVRAAHDWMEEKPHLAALGALAAGILLGALVTPRR